MFHLFEERHGKLLVGDAVSGRADVFFGLVCNVEVNPHQDVFLQKHAADQGMRSLLNLPLLSHDYNYSYCN